MTMRNQGEFDGIALNEVARYFICTLYEVSIQSLYTVYSSNGCGMFGSS